MSSKIYFGLAICIQVLLFQSCVSHQELISLNGSDPAMEYGKNEIREESELVPPPSFVIQPADLLVINMNTFEGNTSEFLQQEFASRNLNVNGGFEYGPDALYYTSYHVDEDGYLMLPLVDKIKVAGLTTNELKIKLDSAYTPYLKFASTSVKLANMRVTILGEVNNPGLHYFFNGRTTILDAISLAGDFSDFGNRRKVKLIRRIDQKSKTVMLDLYKPDFINTEFYFVQPNDILYVEPIKAKAKDVGAQSVGIVLSIISTAALLANLVVNFNSK